MVIFGPNIVIYDQNWTYIVTLKDLQGNFNISAGDQFTKREFAEIKDLFNLFDIDGNGSITPERF